MKGPAAAKGTEHANTAVEHVLCKRSYVPHLGNLAANVETPNHFSTVCLSNIEMCERTKGKLSYGNKRAVKRATNESESDSSEWDDDPDIDFIEDSVRHLKIGKIKVNRVSDFEKTVPIVINDVIVRIEPDSGADVNVMDEHQYKALKQKTYENIDLEEYDTKLSTLQNELHVSGKELLCLRRKFSLNNP